MIISYVARFDQGRGLGILHQRTLISGGFCTGFRKVFLTRFDCGFEIGAQVAEMRSAESPSAMVRTSKQPTSTLLVFVNREDPLIGFLKSSDNFWPRSVRILLVIYPARFWLLACAVHHASRIQCRVHARGVGLNSERMIHSGFLWAQEQRACTVVCALPKFEEHLFHQEFRLRCRLCRGLDILFHASQKKIVCLTVFQVAYRGNVNCDIWSFE